MPSDEHLRRLARELILPGEADLVIQRPKFWTPDFCMLYFERCDELMLDDAEAGLDVAYVALELAELTQRTMRTPQPRLLLRALAVLGSAFRRVDDLDQAEATYRRAFRLVEQEPAIPRWDVANVLFRFAALRAFQYRLEDALGFADSSVGVYREAPEGVRKLHLGEALIVRGYIYRRAGKLDCAMRDFGEALACTQVKMRPNTFFAAVHNLACGVVAGAVLADTLADIERHVAEARRYFNRKPRSVAKLKVLWLRGLIQIRFGSSGPGEVTLRRVRVGFLKMDRIVEMALVSITLGRHYHQTRQLEVLRSLAVDTNTLCQEHCQHEEIRRAVLIWTEAVLAETVSAQVFATTWRLLEDCSFAESVKRKGGHGRRR